MSRLQAYNREAAAVPAGTSQFVKLNILPDGQYTFEIEKAELREIAQGDVLAVKLCVLGGVCDGKSIDYDTWLLNCDKTTRMFSVNERNIGQLKEELMVLGFKVEDWADDFFGNLANAVRVLPGIRFIADKSTNGKYHNLKFVGRGNDSKPKVYTTEELSTSSVIPF